MNRSSKEVVSPLDIAVVDGFWEGMVMMGTGVRVDDVLGFSFSARNQLPLQMRTPWAMADWKMDSSMVGWGRGGRDWGLGLGLGVDGVWGGREREWEG